MFKIKEVMNELDEYKEFVEGRKDSEVGFICIENLRWLINTIEHFKLENEMLTFMVKNGLVPEDMEDDTKWRYGE